MGKYNKLTEKLVFGNGVRTAAQTAMLMAVLTLCSKLLGFVREMIIANYFGASHIVDAYVMSVAMPGILFGAVFSSIATAYMPIYSKINEEQGNEKSSRFTSEVINLFIIFSIFASIVGIIFSDQLVSFFASGFDGETAKLTSFFVKITFSYTLLSSVASILESYLQYKGIFLSQIIAGYAQNIMVVVITIVSAYSSYYYLAYGMLIGTGCRLLYIILTAKKTQLKYSLSLRMKGTAKTIAMLAIPVFIGSSIQQVSTFVDKTLASGLAEGSVSALNYAMLVVQLITGLTTSIFTTIVYPSLAKANSLEDYDRLNSIVSTGTTLILMVSIPFSLGAILYRTQVVQIVFERGAFDANATALTASAFAFYAIGLVSMALNDLLTKVYYSMHDMKLPMIFGGISVITDIVLNLILVRFMAHNGLALSTSIGFITNTILLAAGLRIKYPKIKVIDSNKKVMKVAVSAVLAVGFSYLFYCYIVLPLSNIVAARMVQLGLVVIFALAVYYVLLSLFKIEEVKIIRQLVKR